MLWPPDEQLEDGDELTFSWPGVEENSSSFTNTYQRPHLTDMEPSATNNDDDSTAPSPDNIWDVPESPNSETNTPNTSTMDGHENDRWEKDEAEDELDDFEPFKYHLRPQSREQRNTFMRTWIDQDDTGNYGEKDPNEENRKTRNRKSRLKLRLRSDAFISPDDIDDGMAYDERPPKVIPKLLVTLTFASEAGKTQAEDILTKPPKQSQTQDEVSPNGYRLRKRGASLSTRYYSECNLDKSRFDPDLPDNLTGHPAVRGCWECLGLGVECSLLDNEHAWPCRLCCADDHDCDLITPPKFKRTCERCKRTRSSCSYTYSPVHGEACQQCMDDGFRCVAGPVKDTIPTRIRYERDWENFPYQEPKPFKPRKSQISGDTVDESSEGEHSIKHKGDGKSGRRPSLHQTKISWPSMSSLELSQKQQAGEKRQLDEVNQQSSPSRPVKKVRFAPEPQGETTTIETKFSHPIVFNHDEATDGNCCHFCSDASYATFGLGSKEVEVIKLEDGRGLEEISGGHKGEGVENTRVCISCTTERIPIIMCSTHELRPLEDSDKDKIDVNDAFADLLSGAPRLRAKWCAVCPNLAAYECCAPTEHGEGCGLVVCECCMVLLSGMYDGDLQKMLCGIKDEATEERIFGLRADYELLKEDGLLMRYVLWHSQQ